jgi:hypothetical protein
MAPRKKTVAAGSYRGEIDARLGKKENTREAERGPPLRSLSSDTGVGIFRVFQAACLFWG